MSTAIAATPGLSSFLKSLKHADVETSIEHFISLLKRRQIRNSRPCAIATTQLLLRIVAASKTRDAASLIERVRKVGQRLIAAQPREMAVGNIVRRVLGLIREVEETGLDAGAYSDAAQSDEANQSHNNSMNRSGLNSNASAFGSLNHGASASGNVNLRQDPFTSADFNDTTAAHRPPLLTSHTSYATGPQVTSLFGLLSHPDEPSPAVTPPAGSQSPITKSGSRLNSILEATAATKMDVKAEVIDGIKELVDELEIVDDQIAASALEHIHANEIILTHTSSQTVQKFLIAAARKRKFTVIHAEAYPNDHVDTHATILTGGKKGDDDDEEADERWKPLISMGIQVILIPDSAVFALMSRVNKVILAPHTVLANGGLIAATGALTIAQAAKVHQTPVVVVSGVYKLSPVYPFDMEELVEYGDPGKVIDFQQGDLVENVDVSNPIYDYVSADLVDLYITNLGGHAPSYLYRIVADHYRVDDINLS
ncbi:translation initiation factor eIF-2B subunit beta [Aureobasidium pullulans]|uniref:Translation initiation factor eIF2B subunit beta n=1 Tax=Aureobasidium pullulans TaxID=5580 RepID=A0A4S8V6G4_AURPU|nr:translation initiation factor eIF-2B subunit beta [Aureobasidium pullulans]THW27619.1 translation initiation factor eIF-2B subunit beta [Aureobasidium pullulans]THX99738.1 translation initiation factor eIF-2B subunit beta [Aureobasidium pullulans]THY20398.1 translation initiation factor eIF-2B subunit beta [Aureobasidium pullulans]THY22419.1 translation initiation factor eIF-2B subunit beta [Aureobasidium pullulans]